MTNDWREVGLLTSMLIVAVMWVQVPQWADDWAGCAVDIPDAKCHWYVVAPDNTFGEGFDWERSIGCLLKIIYRQSFFSLK